MWANLSGILSSFLLSSVSFWWQRSSLPESVQRQVNLWSQNFILCFFLEKEGTNYSFLGHSHSNFKNTINLYMFKNTLIILKQNFRIYLH